jgi:copper chaperone CopZ
MQRVTLSAPTMFADHHVLKVREVLFALQGVDSVYASSAWQAVVVAYDEDKIASAAITEALDKAGYGPDKMTPILAESGDNFKDPGWEALGARATQTNQVDLAMSGEFRKY